MSRFDITHWRDFHCIANFNDIFKENEFEVFTPKSSIFKLFEIHPMSILHYLIIAQSPNVFKNML